MSRILSQLDVVDATERYAVDDVDIQTSLQNGNRIVNGPPRKIISWDEDDPENPYNWSVVSLHAVYDIKYRINIWWLEKKGFRCDYRNSRRLQQYNWLGPPLQRHPLYQPGIPHHLVQYANPPAINVPHWIHSRPSSIWTSVGNLREEDSHDYHVRPLHYFHHGLCSGT